MITYSMDFPETVQGEDIYTPESRTGAVHVTPFCSEQSQVVAMNDLRIRAIA
jgi:hypothetical protein